MGKISTRKTQHSPDFATLILVLLMIAFAIAVSLLWKYQSAVDPEAARSAVLGTGMGARGVLTEIDDSYTGIAIIIPDTIEDRPITDIGPMLLSGSNVYHVLMEKIPENVDRRAFWGTTALTIYTDVPGAADMLWAEDVTIRPTSDFQYLINNDGSLRSKTRAFMLNLKGNLHRSTRSLTAILITLLVSSILVRLLGRLRVKCGYSNPLWIIREPGWIRFFYILANIMICIVSFTIMYCESDTGMIHRLYPIDTDLIGNFFNNWPLKITVVLCAIVLISDILHKDFPWCIARIISRFTVMLCLTCVSAVIGFALEQIMEVPDNAEMFNAMYILSFFLMPAILSPGGGGGGKKRGGNQENSRFTRRQSFSGTVFTPENETAYVRYSSGDMYVGDDVIVSESSDYLVGASGRSYQKHYTGGGARVDD